VVGVVLMAIIVIIVVWRLWIYHKTSDEEWVELEKSRQEIKRFKERSEKLGRDKEKDEFKISTTKRLEECLNTPSKSSQELGKSSSTRHLDYIFVEPPDATSNSGDSPSTPVRPSIDISPIIGTPLDMFEDIMEDEMSGSDIYSPVETIPQTPIPATPQETPIDTPLTTPSHTMRKSIALDDNRLQDALSYIDDVLGDLTK